MKEYLQNILFAIVMMALLYLLGSFIELSLNPVGWGIEARIIFSILIVLLILIVSANIIFKD